MSFLKQILSPFVEFEENRNKEPEKAARPADIQPRYEQPQEKVEHPLVNAGGHAPSNQNPAGTRNSITTPLPEHKEYFERLIADANAKNPIFQGTDYKEFIDSKTDIGNITDEETRYKTAFNVLKRTGLTREKLVSTAHEYHNLIGRDLNAFQGAHAQRYQKEVQQREQLIQAKAEELQALSAKINALKKDITEASLEMTDIKDKLNTTKNSFLLAGEIKQHEIQTELQKIEKYFQ
jgi:uncharacterized protein YukE